MHRSFPQETIEVGTPTECKGNLRKAIGVQARKGLLGGEKNYNTLNLGASLAPSSKKATRIPSFQKKELPDQWWWCPPGP
ncbi:hypothetical protein LPTSP4_32030 [Leptospira ryugenii]|uniref:Uncharacterized protein n=1 Tax=Leptospira ryugenii TaxID=1917863 RepID=A0A2P2E453_9LEPT|nr:hypothetical protein LPTSP4_32030 [Leptospira ryugenii]